VLPMVMLGVTDTEPVFLGIEQATSDGTYLTRKKDLNNAIIDILEDQHPHSVAEIALRVNLEAEKVVAFLEFLADYSLVTYDQQDETAVICPDFSALS
jgi:predicted transcriptional regulator